MEPEEPGPEPACVVVRWPSFAKRCFAIEMGGKSAGDTVTPRVFLKLVGVQNENIGFKPFFPRSNNPLTAVLSVFWLFQHGAFVLNRNTSEIGRLSGASGAGFRGALFIR